MQSAEHGVGIDVENGIGGLARIEGEQDGDQPADDMGVAVAEETQARDAVVRELGKLAETAGDARLAPCDRQAVLARIEQARIAVTSGPREGAIHVL